MRQNSEEKQVVPLEIKIFSNMKLIKAMWNDIQENMFKPNKLKSLYTSHKFME